MKNKILIVSLLLVVVLNGIAGAVKMETRSFDVLPTFHEIVIQPEHEERSGEDVFMTTADMRSDVDYKEFFSDMGVTWPEGSKFKYLAAIGKVEITNTSENIKRFYDILILANVIPCLIEIQVDFVEYDLKDIEKLVMENRIGRDSLLALWKSGKGKLLSSGKAVTKSGQECVVKGVTEYLYPTEFEVKPRLAKGKVDNDEPIATVEPQNFEMREVGNILQCVPEIYMQGNLIRLTLNPSHLCPPTWKNYSLGNNSKAGNKTQPPIEHPFVHVYNTSSLINISNGSTVLIGGGMNNHSGSKSVYTFVTVNITDMKGKHIAPVNLDIKNKVDRVTKFETHYIAVDPPHGSLHASTDEINNDKEPDDQEKLWKSFLSEHGIHWPQGAHIKYISGIDIIKITNTPQNIQKFRKFLYECDSIPGLMIETRTDFVEFNITDVNHLTLNNNISYSSLTKLWKEGRATLLSSPCVVTKSGYEGIAKGVTEYIYPTEFTVSTSPSTNQTSESIIAPVVEPLNNEMREAGSNLQVVAEISEIPEERNLIRLLLNPQHILQPEWKDYGTELTTALLPMEQPFFHAYSISTQTTVTNGASILLGGGMLNKQKDKAVFTFLTTKVIDIYGDPINYSVNNVSNNNNENSAIQDEKELVREFIKVPYTFFERLSTANKEFLQEANTQSPQSQDSETYDMKQFFKDLGASWSKGSSVTYNPTFGVLNIKNTSRQIEICKFIVSDYSFTPRLINIYTDFVEFDTDDIQNLGINNIISEKTLRKLWKQGKGQLCYSSYAQTRRGLEAEIKGVTECIYPSEFRIKTAIMSSGTIDVAEPRNFDMCETGNILQVVPEISAEGKFINLMINPQFREIQQWKQYGNGKNLNMPQPFFHSYSTSTQVTVKNGETILLGGGMNNPAGDKTVFIFLKAEIVDERGEPMDTPED